MLQTLRTGVKLEDGLARFQKIEYRGGEGRNHWFHVTLSEGRNREVRRLWESQEVQVSRLIRVRYGDLEMHRQLPLGGWTELPLKDVNYYRKLVQLSIETVSKVKVDEKAIDNAKSRRIRRSVKNIITDYNKVRVVVGSNINATSLYSRRSQSNFILS